MIAFNHAQTAFRSYPTNQTAGRYLSEATELETNDDLDDDAFHNVISEVTYWLLYGSQIA